MKLLNLLYGCFFIIPMISKPALSTEQIEQMISILHERKNPFPYGSHKKDIIHISPATTEKECTRVTHFAPINEPESNEVINKVCTQYQKLWWIVSYPKFNLEQRLQEHHLKLLYSPTLMILPLTTGECPTAYKEGIIERIDEFDQNLVHYQLIKNNENICKATLFFHDTWVGIIKVETQEKYRRQGFATYLIKHLLHIAQSQSTQWALLESTEQALPLYKKLGFTTVLKLGIYNRE